MIKGSLWYWWCRWKGRWTGKLVWMAFLTAVCVWRRPKLSPILVVLGFCLHQGWAGIPVPGHSQEWRPLIPVPELWEWIFSFPSRSRISGMSFFIPFPFPNFGNGFFHSLPVPELRECFFSIPFPFPNFGNGFFFIPFPFLNSGNGFFHSLLVPELRIWNYLFSFPFPNSQKSFLLTPVEE